MDMFKGAQFGDKFRTREGWYAVYDGTTYYGQCGKGHIVHELRYRGKGNKYCITVLRCEDDGTLADGTKNHPYDIVGKWNNDIDIERAIAWLNENTEWDSIFESPSDRPNSVKNLFRRGLLNG